MHATAETVVEIRCADVVRPELEGCQANAMSWQIRSERLRAAARRIYNNGQMQFLRPDPS